MRDAFAQAAHAMTVSLFTITPGGCPPPDSNRQALTDIGF